MKTLVAYFSATGTTGVVATKLAEAINADLYEIAPEEPYTNDDLNWRDKNSRSSIEMEDESSRPVIGGTAVEDMSQYDLIFLGAPIWWYRFPHIVNTFLESYDFSGKKIILFATSGSSGFGKSADALSVSAPGAEIVDGEVIRGEKTAEDLKAFAAKFL
jgi:Flavodoxins